MNWVNEVVLAHSESEAPERFFYWSALATLSACVRKNVWLDRFYYKLYPNIYVFLVAASGMKKSVPVTLCKSLLSRANCTRTIIGRTSVPAVLKDLGRAQSLENGTVLSQAHGILLSGELASFLVKDPDALTILTDLHDTHAYEKEWINNLKLTGTDKLKAPCLALLGATNEEHFGEAVPPNAIGGGFIARTFIVFSTQRGTLNSLTKAPKQIADLDKLAEHVIRTSQVKGAFKWEDDAIKLYDAWYYNFHAIQRPDPTGTMNRIGDQALKVAMLLSLAASDDLILTKSQIEEAITVSLDCINGLNQVTMGQGKSGLASQTKLVMRELLGRSDHRIERQKLLQKYWGEFTHFELDTIIETLLGAGAIRIEQQGAKRFYVMPDSVVDTYTNFKKGIQ